MVDVIHYFFEEDMMHASTGEQLEAISDMRTELYRMYGKTYSYGVSKKSKTSRAYVGEDFDFDNDVPFDPANQETKPFVPATEFDPDSSMPFGGVLDAPLG